MGLRQLASDACHEEKQAPDWAPVSFGDISPVAVVVPVVPIVVAIMPRAIAADLARPIIGPDHPAVAVRITVISGVIRRSVEAPEVVPVNEVRPEVGLPIAAMVKCAIAATTTAEHGRGAEAAAMECGTTTVEATTSAVETAAAMTAATMATAAVSTTTMSAANLDHRSIGRDFR